MIGAKAYLEVLGTHTEETLPSVMITTNDTTRLLFNIGEGLIRSSTEHNVKATRASHLFVTHLSSDAVSEFTTFFLRSHLTGTRTTHICGPPNLANFIFTNRYITNRNHTIVLTECEGGEKITRGGDWPVVETIGIKSTVPFSDASKPAKIPPTAESEGALALSIEKIHLIKGRGSTFTEFLNFLKFRGGLVDGYRHLDREMHVQFFNKYPHPEGGDIPPDFYGEVASNNAPSDKSQLNLNTRHFRMELRSARVLRQTHDERMERFRSRADLFVNEPIFGPIKSLVYTIPPVEKEFTVLSYIVRTPIIKGTFDAKKAASLGVPRGPLFGKLQKGEPIVTPEGKEVFSEQVMSPSIPGPIFAIVSCPYKAMIGGLIGHSAWSTLRSNNEQVSVVVHFGPRHVVDTDEYRVFLSSFGDSCQHIFIGQGMCREHPIYTASMTQTAILNTLSSRWFPLPFLGDSTPSLPDNLPKKSIQGDHFMKFVGVPLEKMGLHTGDCVPRFDSSAACKEYAKIADGQTTNSDSAPSGFSEKELEIVFFGTGCSAASSLRNETAIYLDFFGKGGMLMDVGGGTYGQMYRKYGPTRIVEVLSNLKVIWISHMHADHMQGIVRVLHMRHKALLESGRVEERVLVIGPHTLYEVLCEHLECTVCTCKYKKEHHREFVFNFVDSHDLSTPSPILKEALGLETVYSISVYHSFMAQALMMKHVNGWSLVFSGDTSYCPKMIATCQSPTVLIHEASFEDAEGEKAASKAHCTTSQAIETGERMNAKCTLLTHFSQRYRNLTVETQLHNVSPAFDFMCVNLADHLAVSKYGATLASLGKISNLVGASEDEYLDLE